MTTMMRMMKTLFTFIIAIRCIHAVIMWMQTNHGRRTQAASRASAAQSRSGNYRSRSRPPRWGVSRTPSWRTSSPVPTSLMPLLGCGEPREGLIGESLSQHTEFTNLRKLDLRGTCLSDDDLLALSGDAVLLFCQVLLSRSRAHLLSFSSPPSSCSGLTQLEDLNLKACDISYLGMAALQRTSA